LPSQHRSPAASSCSSPLGKAEPDLEHQAGPGGIGDRCSPRALPARLERLAYPQRPTASQVGHDLWKIGDPVAHALIVVRGLGQIPRHNEGRHSKTLYLPARKNVKGAGNEDRRSRRPGPVSRPRLSDSGRTNTSPARTVAGYRDYDPAVVERLAFIWHAQAAGLTLERIRQVLDLRDSGQPPCIHVTGLIAQRQGEVEARLAELTRTRDQLVILAARAAAQDPADCRGYCSIIAG
jgi:DNA-binding transcriptional MerR regulator